MKLLSTKDMDKELSKDKETIKKQWDKWFKSPLQKGKIQDYGINDKSYDHVSETIEEVDLTAIEDDTFNLLAKVSYLQGEIPQALSTTIFGIQDIEPNGFDKFIFLEKVRTILHPSYLLESSKHGALSNYVVDTLIMFDPDYLELNRLAITELMVEYRTNPKNAPKHLNRVKQAVLAKVFQTTRFNAEVIAKFQMSYAGEQEQSSGSKEFNVAQNNLTQSQSQQEIK